MSSKQGDSFEARIALILSSAGFVVKDQPHIVYLNGENVGDLDVLAVDPNTSTLIGVSCKEYLSSNVPGSQHFSHFAQMLEYENIKYGIFASATTVASTFQSLVEYQRQKGKTIIVLTEDEIKQLEKFAFSNQKWELENYFRTALGIESKGKTTIGHSINAQKTVFIGKTVECENLIPVQFWNTPPAYIKNPDFTSDDAVLRLEPFLVVKYDLHFDPIRHPRTNEILAEPMYVEGTKIIDLGKGKILDEDDPISEHLGRYYQNAVSNTPIIEKGFTIKKIETIDNGKVLVNRIKSQVASENVRRADYLDGKQERVEKVQAAKADEVHTLIHKVYLPIWEVIFKLGGNVYKRTYFAYDGDSIYDEMKNCKICKKQTSYVCVECGATVCDAHEKGCRICSIVLCTKCATSCVDCKSGFCKSHKPKTSCGVCNLILCDDCNTRLCVKCNQIICPSHYENCEECTSIVCENHIISKRYIAVPKKFCSDECLKKYDADYNSSGKLGKIKKAFWR